MRKETRKKLISGVIAGLILWLLIYSGGAPLAPLISIFGTQTAARAAQIAAFLGWGLCCSLVSLLWEGERGGFFIKSAGGLLLVGTGMALWVWTLHGWDWNRETVELWLGGTVVLFVLDWVVRFMSYRQDVERIRAKLGLAPPAATPLHWGETLPDMLLMATLFLGLRPLLGLLDANDVPVLTALLLPWFLWPFIAAGIGFGLGKRVGIAPLYPLAVGVAFLPNLLYAKVPYDWRQAVVYALLALAGNALGALCRRWKTKGCKTGENSL